MFYTFFQEKITLFHIPEKWESTVVLLVSYAGLLLLTLLVKQMFLLIDKLIIRKVILKSKNQWDDVLLKLGITKQVVHLISAIVILALYPLFIVPKTPITLFIKRVLIAILYAITAKTVARFLEVVNEIYNQFNSEIAKRKPIKGYLQMIKIFLYIIAIILMITTLFEKSPVGILSGLGALSAVFMLIFKDPIMGFVSSIQLTANDLVRIGDWVQIPKYGADGAVLDITLQTIRVQNWDKSITSVPVYALVSDSFTNWRGMFESGGRRIKKAIYIDMKMVRFLTDAELDELEKLPRLTEYLQKKRAEIAEYNASLNFSHDDSVTPRRLTNLGTFRAYVNEYLKGHPLVHKEFIAMARYLDPTSKGIPMELYFFAADTVWVNVERLQGDVLDHVLSVIHYFDLAVFQDPSGSDFRELTSP